MGALARIWQRRRGVWLDVLPALLYLGVLFWAGLIPLQQLPGPDFKMVDKVWHLGAFGGLAALLARSLAYFGRPAPLAARDAALSSGFLGALLEVLQSFTPYRSADWADLLADVLGALLAYFVLRLLARGAAREPSLS